MLDPKEIKTSGNNPRRLDSEAHKLQDYLRDAAQYIFDTYGNEALQRLTDDFDGCMKEFHDHRMEVFKKLQTPEGVAMIRELTLGKIRDREEDTKRRFVIRSNYGGQYVGKKNC